VKSEKEKYKESDPSKKSSDLSTFPFKLEKMVGVAQLAERWIVAPEVVGSSPITHPI